MSFRETVPVGLTSYLANDVAFNSCAARQLFLNYIGLMKSHAAQILETSRKYLVQAHTLAALTTTVEAIAKLGFVPNPVARGLAGGRTFSIGVVTHVLDSPFYGSALRGIEEKLLPLGYSPLFVSGEWNAEVETRSTRTRWTACRATAPRLVSRESCRRLSIQLPRVLAKRGTITCYA
jgi:hypothetical protein